jgi:simple sugar transport system ATP-binding protein
MNIAELRNISKQYLGSDKKANNNISLDLQKGEILCIAGENGAGKTTLMKILCGLEKHDTGTITINGTIGMVHQHFMLFPEYTVAENIVMGNEPRKWGLFFDKKKANQIAQKIITENNFAVKSTAKVSELTSGEKQQVEICRVLNCNAELIILDEPTSILTEQETKSLFKTLRLLVEKGKSVILITHKLHEIKQISDRVIVLRRGELAGMRNAEDIDEYEIARMMIGEETASENYQRPFAASVEKKISAEPVITFENVTVKRLGQKRPLLDNVSFLVSSGEILGFAGVGGNGLGVIEAVLGGFLQPASGKILHRGKDISKLTSRTLRKQGLAYVPADRIRVGSAADANIEENMIINRRHELKRNKISRSLIIDSWLKKYNIDTPNIKEKCSALSGGNLQKIILAREINWFKDYIVFSEPTWGLDIKSSRFIMEEIDALRRKGAAVILISTDLDEIIALADRVIVMCSGKIAGEFGNINMSIKEDIGKCMLKS